MYSRDIKKYLWTHEKKAKRKHFTILFDNNFINCKKYQFNVVSIDNKFYKYHDQQILSSQIKRFESIEALKKSNQLKLHIFLKKRFTELRLKKTERILLNVLYIKGLEECILGNVNSFNS